MNERSVAVVFQPGGFIQEEMDARGWNAGHLAGLIGCTTRNVDAIIAGVNPITQDIANRLGLAFGTSQEYWSNLAGLSPR